MKDATELGELLVKCNEQSDKVLDWYREHADDEVFKTEEGGKLKHHIVEMIRNEALAMISLGIIELEEAMKHPEITISEETFNAFKEAIECMEGS